MADQNPNQPGDDATATTRLPGEVKVYAEVCKLHIPEDCRAFGDEYYTAEITFPGIALSWGKPACPVLLTENQCAAFEGAISRGVSKDALLDAILRASHKANGWRNAARKAEPVLPAALPS